jgi:hypothetical protein
MPLLLPARWPGTFCGFSMRKVRASRFVFAPKSRFHWLFTFGAEEAQLQVGFTVNTGSIKKMVQCIGEVNINQTLGFWHAGIILRKTQIRTLPYVTVSLTNSNHM